MDKKINLIDELLSGIEAVIFDLDGTLVDSMWMWRQIDVEYLARHHYEVPPWLSDGIEGLSFHETAVFVKEKFRLNDSLDKIKSDWNEMAYAHYENDVKPKPGALDFLEYLKKKGIHIGIATSNSRELAEAVLKARDLEAYFDVVSTSQEVWHGKPAPDIYLHVASELHTTPDKCLVFEDVAPGIRAGLAAGMRVCCIYDENCGTSAEELEALAGNYIRSFHELLEME